jgi:aminoglycoside phosphotransferase (APT) family kinase protein
MRREIDELSFILDDATLGQLEKTMILGELHVGQVLFDGQRVSAVLSLDRATPGPILRDLADGLMYCCTRRTQAMDPSDPWAMTAPWQVDDDRTEAFLRGYNGVTPLPRSWPWLGAMMLSRWLESRLSYIHNITSDKQLEFVLRDIDRPVDLLKRHVQAWLRLLIGRL